jgi:UDP-2,3-diacylglucosamine pyrophosphatase LpxH
MQNRRSPDIVVISDVHLSTYGCHASELNSYLKTLAPRILVLNGDIIDGWSFTKNYFPEAHWKVLRRLMKMMNEGTRIYYLTGNHDEFLRRFSGVRIGKLKIDDKLLLEHNGKKYWFFHGDIFDITMKHSRWLARLGGKGYDVLIIFNRLVNRLLEKMGREKISLSKRIKNSVKQAVKFIDDFEQTAIDLAMDDGLDYVICGHIHHPVIREVSRGNKQVIYMNPGDWIENLTALECEGDRWQLVHFQKANTVVAEEDELQHERTELKQRVIHADKIYESIPLILLNAGLRNPHE